MKNIKMLMIGISLVILAACGGGNLTSANLTKIETGMEKSEVIKILGNPSKEETSSTLGISGTTMIYKGGGSEIKIVLVNDKVLSKNGSFK